MAHIVLCQPEIAPNTGNIARLCAGVGFELHLIRPLGFSLHEKHLKRAGLDTWPHVQMTVHLTWSHFIESQPKAVGNCFFFTSQGKQNLWQSTFHSDAYLVFGSETQGFDAGFRQQMEKEKWGPTVKIPLPGGGARCLNLSNAAAIGAFETLRQIEVLKLNFNQ